MSNDNCCDEKESCCCSANVCCSSNLITPYDETDKWVTGEISVPNGSIPCVATQRSFKDIFGAWKVRWDIGRANYRINPGLYAVGNPDDTSPVLVSANYKLTFDMLRKELSEMNLWILILDTKGINVWCAAGKGTFGTDELVSRVKAVELSGIVSHRTLIVPQLGAPGMSAHEVKKLTGFSVVYGPVRARDIRAFLDSGMKATEDMRTVKFTAWNRLVLTPLEFIRVARISITMFGVLFLINLFAARPFGLGDFTAYASAVLIGTVITPALLPAIPGKAFAFKGCVLGLFVTACIVWFNGWFTSGYWLLAIGYMLALPAHSAFLAMNFTGSSTYTSFSGVIKEMKIAVPIIAISLVVGVTMVLIKTFTG